jgi:hypothetical protein
MIYSSFFNVENSFLTLKKSQFIDNEQFVLNLGVVTFLP